MSAVDHTTLALDILVTRLHESHEVSAYDAIERLVSVAEAVGFGADALIRMLDRGMGLEELIELIGSRVECLERATEFAVENKTAA